MSRIFRYLTPLTHCHALVPWLKYVVTVSLISYLLVTSFMDLWTTLFLKSSTLDFLLYFCFLRLPTIMLRPSALIPERVRSESTNLWLTTLRPSSSSPSKSPIKMLKEKKSNRTQVIMIWKKLFRSLEMRMKFDIKDFFVAFLTFDLNNLVRSKQILDIQSNLS